MSNRTSEDPDSTVETASTEGFERWIAEATETVRAGEDARVDVFVRSLLPPPGAKDAQTEILDRLDESIDETPASMRVQVWGQRICRCEICQDTEIGRIFLDRIETLTSWGDRFDADASAVFDYTSQESSVTGSTYEGIRPPQVTAVLYVDGVVTGVFPNRFGDRHVTVVEFVDLLPTLTKAERAVGGTRTHRLTRCRLSRAYR
jgi:hypothetical protein